MAISKHLKLPARLCKESCGLGAMGNPPRLGGHSVEPIWGRPVHTLEYMRLDEYDRR